MGFIKPITERLNTGRKPPASRYADFSGVNHRPDIPDQFRIRDENGQTYVKFGDPAA